MREFTEAITMSGSKVEGWTKEGSEIDNVAVSYTHLASKFGPLS